MRLPALMSLVAWLIMTTGCDWIAQKSLQPGVSTEADVRKLMGQPELVWEENNGERVLEYPRSPMGTETYMVTIGSDGKYRSMVNVLVREQFVKVKAGMSRDDVRRLLGRPTDIVYFQLKEQEVWSYKHMGEMSDKDNFHVHFDGSGRVVNTSTTRDPQFQNA